MLNDDHFNTPSMIASTGSEGLRNLGKMCFVLPEFGDASKKGSKWVKFNRARKNCHWNVKKESRYDMVNEVSIRVYSSASMPLIRINSLLQSLDWILLKCLAPFVPLPRAFTHGVFQVVLNFSYLPLLVFPVLRLSICVAGAPAKRLEHICL
jgi:hypothetical protein